MSRPLVLITGASSGIGRALVIEAARRGYDSIAVARRVERLNDLKAEVSATFPAVTVQLVVADVTAPDYESKLRNVLPLSRPLAMAIVNAGVGSAGRFEKLSMQVYENVLKTNVLAAIRTSQIVLPNLLVSGGHLALVGSLNGHIANPLAAAYSTSKFALRGFAETLRAELWHRGVRVSLVSPGPVETEIFTKSHEGKIVDAKLPTMKRLDVQVAARRIFNGVLKSKREFSLSFSTNLALRFARHFPGAVSWIMRQVYSRYEPKFLELVGKVNPESV